jgi:microcystin-dependent protein
MADPFIGHITMFAGTYIPRGYAECNGQLLAISENESLYSLLGTQFGGDGHTTFALPDYRGRIPIGVGYGPGLYPIQYGERSGLEKVTLTVSNLPSHSHLMVGTHDAATSPDPSGNLFAAMDESADPAAYKLSGASFTSLPEDTLDNAGGSQAHSNMMPYMTIRFIIATHGVYPTRSE